jgi:hypothetical protein
MLPWLRGHVGVAAATMHTMTVLITVIRTVVVCMVVAATPTDTRFTSGF